MKKRRLGFTLIELMIVITIICLLLGLFGIVASKMKLNAQTSQTKALIQRVRTAFEAYYLTYRGFPPMGATGATTFPNPWPVYPNTNTNTNIYDLDITILTNWESTARFKLQDYDPTTPPGISSNTPAYLVDAWYVKNDGKDHRIQYRKSGPDRILVWSNGPQGYNGIGMDIYEMWPNAAHPSTSSTNFNISNLQIDSNSTNSTSNANSSN